MPESMRVLVLTATVGAGHTKAAEAIQNAFNSRYPQVQVDLVDTFSFAGPRLGRLVFGTYLAMIKRFPRIYGYMYKKSEKDTLLGQFSQQQIIRWLTKFMAKPLQQLVENGQYDQIICTHPFALGMVSRLKHQLGWQIPLHAVLTDFAAHHCWIYPNVSSYYVAHQKVQEELIQQRVDPRRIHVTGIPIDQRFASSPEPSTLLTSLGLAEDRINLLVMGGGLGWGPVEEIVLQLANTQLPCQLIVVTGTNKQLYINLQGQAKAFSMPCKIYGFIDFIPDLLAITDLLITKPGGLTAAEALAKHVPMIIPGAIAGHEESNAQFLIDQGAAVQVSHIEDIESIVANYCDAGALGLWKQSIGQLGQPQAAAIIAQLVWESHQG